MSREHPEARVAAIASRQHGAFSRRQALELGVPSATISRRLRARLWIPSYPGVYVIAGSEPSWARDVSVGLLAAGSRAVVSHLAGGALLEFPGFPQIPPEFSIPRASAPPRHMTVHRPHELARVDITTVKGFPVTTAARTLIDVADIVDTAVLEEALDDALRRGLVSVPFLRRRLTALGTRGRAGSAVLQRLIAARSDLSEIPQSVFESRLLRILRRAGLPQPEIQYRLRDGARLVAVLDFAFPFARVAIEADGYRWHSGRQRWAKDLARRNAITALGWRVIHIVWADLDRPDVIVEMVRGALARTG